MKHSRFFLSISTVFLAAASASAQTGFPFQDENLRYSINWPSGLSLGDATFTAHRTETGWGLSATLDVGVPGFPLKDNYHSTITKDLCSLQLDRDIDHGTRKTREKTTFDQQEGKAKRATLLPESGGTSDFDIGSCARDALAFVYYVREEMGQGRVAPPQTVYFGSPYSVRIDYTGPQDLTVSERQTVTDHVVVSVKGPKSDFNFEIFFARDAARTPLSIRVPVSVGTISMELVR
jgi:hypothetical protein